MNRFKTPQRPPGPDINLKPTQVISRAFVRWWDDFINLAVVSTVLLVSWATILLGPPATFGLFYIASDLARGESQGLKGMLEGARRYFLKSWLWMLANLFVIVTAYENYLFYGRMSWEFAWVIQDVVLLVGGLWIGIQLFTLPYFMYQEKPSLWTAWRNALFTFLASPGYTLVLWLVVLIVAALSIITILPVLLGGAGLISVLASEAVRERIGTFQAAMKKESGGEE